MIDDHYLCIDLHNQMENYYFKLAQTTTSLQLIASSILLMMLTMIVSSSVPVANGHIYIQEACKVTRYQDICFKTLASFSNRARSRSRWARAGVSVSIRSTKATAAFLADLKHNRNLTVGSWSHGALLDCVELVQDALDNLHWSLKVLRNLEPVDFEFQMSDLLTWLSAALTDETTCVDGLEGMRGKMVVVVYNKVVNVSCITSNALALANWLANNGP